MVIQLRKRLALTLLLFSLMPHSTAAETLLVPVHDGNEISTERFAAKGDTLMVWLMPEYGFRVNHRHLAKQLATQGIEVWQPNIV